MLFGIDGTGPWSIGQYRDEFKNSFVRRLVSQSKQWPKRYWPGPTLDGDSCYVTARGVALEIKCILGVDKHQKVFLAGYSRGGAICITVAQLLRRNDIKVDCMILFDAVDRLSAIGARRIPGNVVRACHAMRDDKLGSRWYFGHCGASIESPGLLLPQRFWATHAAMGGMPGTGDHPFSGSTKLPSSDENFDVGSGDSTERGEIFPKYTITDEQDKAAADRVEQWMWPLMRKFEVL
jgi:pimeloyl-ACP methyl ester carboxylesterase